MPPPTASSSSKAKLSLRAPTGKAAKSQRSLPSSSKGKGLSSVFLNSKGKRPRGETGQAEDSDANDDDDSDESIYGAAAAGGDDDDDDDEVATDEEISQTKARNAKSAKTSKRKRRAVSPGTFGDALNAFLGDDDEEAGLRAPEDPETIGTSSVDRPAAKKPKATTSLPANQAPIFSLAPSIRSRISSTQLSARAARVALEERKVREDRFRIKDLIGGWGRPGELPGVEERQVAGDDDDEERTDDWMLQGGSKGYERKLRKVAQRGGEYSIGQTCLSCRFTHPALLTFTPVVKLFNAIRAAQSTTTEDIDDASSKAKLAAIAPQGPTSRNALGGKEKELRDLSKANFLDLIRGGGAGSAAKTKPAARA